MVVPLELLGLVSSIAVAPVAGGASAECLGAWVLEVLEEDGAGRTGGV